MSKKPTIDEQLDKCISEISVVLYNLTSAKGLNKDGTGDAVVGSLDMASAHAKDALKVIEKIKSDFAELPLEAFPSKELLHKFEPNYFAKDRFEGIKWNEEKACYALATWVFDNCYGHKEATLDRTLLEIENAFGKAVANKVAKFYEDGNHDT
jgi:hypothetical protein